MVCVILCLIVSFPVKVVNADEARPVSNEMKIEEYIHQVYGQIDFSASGRLSYDVFANAYKGYLNLKDAGKLNTDVEVISICDFNLPSTEKRLWIIDMAAGKVLFNTYVAHGSGSGEDYAENFSNNFDSHQSSLGFYVTGDTYNGEHGLSLRLNGMDQGFNDAALDRGIVVHGANYVCEKYVAGNMRLGRSWGCPAVPDKLKVPIIKAIQGGTCLFISHTDNKYQRTAYWMNKKVDHLPQNNMFGSIVKIQSKMGAKLPLKMQVQYISNGKLDSVKNIY